MAGGKNIAATTTTSYAQITNEFLVEMNPDIIVLTVGPMAPTTVEELTNRTGWKSTNAIKDNNIYTIDDDIISRPGPRIINALEQLALIFHPNLFLYY
jgi:iron complex transport system substrate-binding protein